METRMFPINQRRLRANTQMRELTASVHLSAKSFIQPLFVEAGLHSPRTVNGLPFVQVDTRESILNTIEADIERGIDKFLLFPVPLQKAETNFDFSFAAELTRSIKTTFGNKAWIAADLCLCSYTTHGHCGILNDAQTKLLNSPTVDQLSRYAAILAQAGADCIAPSDMTDGRIAAIRNRLDALDFEEVSILSYAAKFSSQLYGPFRDACHSTPRTDGLRDRKTYQLSPANLMDAIRTALRDEQEGADMLMVKPATLYLDIIREIRSRTMKPLVAYHVSGEYAALELLAANGLADRARAHLEVWTALQRSGADCIISYAAREARTWIENQSY